MYFPTTIKACFNKYAGFKGRASRSEFWFVIFGTFFVGLATLTIGAALFGLPKVILHPIWYLIIMLPTVAVTVRRLHDTDRSGWLLLYFHITIVISIGSVIYIIPSPDKQESAGAIGGIVFIVVAALGSAIYVLSLPGTQGPNQYGDDPLVSASQQDAGQVNDQASNPPEHNRTPTDYLALLERLYDLGQKGILTAAELKREKKRILRG